MISPRIDPIFGAFVVCSIASGAALVWTTGDVRSVILAPLVGILTFHALCVVLAIACVMYAPFAATPPTRLKRTTMLGNTRIGACARLLLLPLILATVLLYFLSSKSSATTTTSGLFAAAALAGVVSSLREVIRRFLVPSEAEVRRIATVIFGAEGSAIDYALLSREVKATRDSYDSSLIAALLFGLALIPVLQKIIEFLVKYSR